MDAGPVWRKASYCANTECVEVACMDTQVLVRDGKDRAGPNLAFSADTWTRFIAAVKRDEFSA